MIQTIPFDNYSIEYDKWFDKHSEEYNLELKAIKQFIPLQGKGIEVGAGTGRFSAPLNIGIGVEPSRVMAEIAARRSVSMVIGDIETLPIARNTFDYALLVTVDCFLDSLVKAFTEVYRILKEGGIIIVGFIDRDSPLGKVYIENRHKSKFYQRAKFHTVAEIQNGLLDVGFKNIENLQAILPADVCEPDKPGIKIGSGEGSFVVSRAVKQL